MKYEIDFLPVGTGDSSGDAIALRYAEDDSDNYKVMVIDGGTKESGQNLVDHIIEYYGTDRVDYVVNTHPDQDHASGLTEVLEQLKVGELWIHRPWAHTSEVIEHFKDQRITEESLAERFKKDFRAAYELEEIANEKGIIIHEPYQGKKIGQFTVMSPNRDWYLHTLLPKFDKTPESKAARALQDITARIRKTILNVVESLSLETLKEGGKTSADNESSVILHTVFNQEGIVLTGDAGIEALQEAVAYSPTISENLEFIQVPHHGSRRNVSPSVLDNLLGNKEQTDCNKIACVSAGKESTKHPRKIVVNAFTRRGCKVYSTKGKTIHHRRGMPNREGWTSAIPLAFSDKVESYE